MLILFILSVRQGLESIFNNNSSKQGKSVNVELSLQLKQPKLLQEKFEKDLVKGGMCLLALSFELQYCGLTLQNEQTLTSCVSKLEQSPILLRNRFALHCAICELETEVNWSLSEQAILIMPFDIFANRMSMMKSARMSRMQVLNVKIIIIFFQKLSQPYQVLNLLKPDIFLRVSFIRIFEDKYIIILVRMKPISMKVPPLNQLYEQKQGYQAHKKKLQRIMSDRKNQLLEFSRGNNSKKIITNFERRYNVKSLELARENSRIIQKIQKVKSNLSKQQSTIKPSQSRVSSAFRTKSKILEQQRQNYRIKNKVQSMNSSLSSKLMDKDYRRSLQIRNRIMHFKTEENHVMLKANRYLGSYHQSASNIALQIPLKDPLPHLPNSNNFNRDIIQKKMSKVTTNVASHYKKEEVMKNRVINTNKLFKLARERRSKAITMLQKSNSKVEQQNIKQQENTVFPTELTKLHK